MTCKTCNLEKPRDNYLNCATCREDEADKRRERYNRQQRLINPYFEPRNEKVDGMTKVERGNNFKEKVSAAMVSCPMRSVTSAEYESTVTYCGLCGEETLERYLFKCLCPGCRVLIRHDYAAYEQSNSINSRKAQKPSQAH